MWKTIKAKIIATTLAMLFILCFITLILVIIAYHENTALKIESTDNAVLFFSEKINKSVKQLEKNAIAMALISESFYRHKPIPPKSYLNELIKRNFEQVYLPSGGGVWLEPYAINKHQKQFCTYIHKKGSEIKLNKLGDECDYPYHNVGWYKSIRGDILRGVPAYWSLPYNDELNNNELMVSIGAGIYDKNHKLIGISTIDWTLESIIKEINSLKITPKTMVLFIDENHDYIIAINGDPSAIDAPGKPLHFLSWYKPNIQNKGTFEYNKTKYVSFVNHLDNGMGLVVSVPQKELFKSIVYRLQFLMITLFLTCIAIAAGIYYMLAKYINKPIQYVVSAANCLGAGNFDAKMDITEPLEFYNIAVAFNKMAEDIKRYIKNLKIMTDDKKKYEQELDLARAIQHSALPSVFPPFPDYSEFEIYALLRTAKEVGGDFYDFFFIDYKHLVVLIADVSGKGVPAALFMMTAKTLIKNLAKKGHSPEELMIQINKAIYGANKEDFFITIFLGLLDVTTGKMSCVNAGHNLPLIYTNNGDIKTLDCPANIVAGALEDFPYVASEINLSPGDAILMYTDGVTEAKNINNELYGTQRLEEELKNVTECGFQPERVLHNLDKTILAYEGPEHQSDDIALLALKYNGSNNLTKKGESKMVVEATIENYSNTISWLEKLCADAQMKRADILKLQMAVEEIFVNISSYAYSGKKGDVSIIFKLINKNLVELQFMDSGFHYNPLSIPDPNITLTAEDRPIGGLGVFLVKNTMDFVGYEYIEGKNVLTIRMNFDYDEDSNK